MILNNLTTNLFINNTIFDSISSFFQFIPANQVGELNSILTNYITVISILIGISSFILGFYIEKISKTTTDYSKKYLTKVVLSLIFPSLLLVIMGLVISLNDKSFYLYTIIFLSLFYPIFFVVRAEDLFYNQLFLLSSSSCTTNQGKEKK